MARLLKDLSQHTQAREYVRCALGIEIKAPRGGLSLARAPVHYTYHATALARALLGSDGVPHCTSTGDPRTQVIAISHHREFHELADHIVRLHAADGRTVATYDR